jgi:GNAT superfamily N-acetyltransferase
MHDSIFLNTQQATNYELIKEDGLIVGSAIAIEFVIHPEEFDYFVVIQNLHINPQFTRQGYASALVKKIIRDNQSAIICLECKADKQCKNHLDDEQLYQWYLRSGFVNSSPFHEGDRWMHRPAKSF